MASITVVFTEAHVTRGETGPDTIELVGTCGDKPVALSAIEPRGLGDEFVRGLGFEEFILNEPAAFPSASGHSVMTVAAHRVAGGKKFRKDRVAGKDFEVEVNYAPAKKGG